MVVGGARREVTTPSRWDAILEQSASAFLAGHFAEPLLERERVALVGTIVGNYRLIREIGRGGMGAVWLAERADGQFEQYVAVKLVKRGMDSDEILARFLRERQILARLNHPNIARLLDGGVGADGMPYFVMEYIAGEPITDWCDERRLSIANRLSLFVSTCAAVQYAHRSLVVHRDIKPSNVLVTLNGEVKLLDFGVAKLLESDVESTAATRGPMTTEYASPEQLFGAPVTTATDVYQLGVLLYELLTGHRPWGKGRGSPEAVEEARFRDPRRPSTVSRTGDPGLPAGGSPGVPDETSLKRGTTPERLKKRLRGDLDSIVLKALSRKPDDRYQSAEAFADDVERHLTQRPVQARDAGLADRALRFVRRHRLRVSAATALGVMLLGGSALNTRRIRAERDAALRDAAKLAQGAELVRQVFSNWSPDAANRGEVNAAAILQSEVRRAETELHDQPEMLAASLSTLGELFANIGQAAPAESLLARALAIQQAAGAQAGPDLAATLARQGRLIMSTTGSGEESIAILGRALDLHRELFGERRIETLRVRRDLALAHRIFGDHRDAETGLAGILAALSDADRNSTFGLEVAADLGYMYFLQARYDDAATLLRRTLEQQRQMFGGQNAAVLMTMRYLASTLRDRGDLDEAERLYRDALRIAQNLYGAAHPQTGFALGVLSILLDRKGNLEESERLIREELTIIGRTIPTYWQEVIRLGAIRLDRGDPVEAERWLRMGLDSLRRMYPAGHPDEADALNRLAYILTARGAPEADQWYRRAADFDRARKAGSPVFVSDGLHFLASAHYRHSNVAAAESTYNRALALYRVQLPANHAYTTAALKGLDQVLRGGGK